MVIIKHKIQMASESEIKDLKAMAYDIYVQIQTYQMAIENLKPQLIEINNKLQKAIEDNRLEEVEAKNK